MTKRTKRYGGFLIGDRVRVKETRLSKFGEELLEGNVIMLKFGMVMIESIDSLNHVFRSWHSPTQLINLTRLEEHLVSKSLMNEKLKNQRDIQMTLDFVAEALRQTELFLSPLTPYGDPLPSPYTRDVYTSTKDYFVS